MNEAAPMARARLEVILGIESLLRRLPPWLLMGSCWLLLALVAWADHTGGLDLHLEAFYLLPVVVVAWICGRLHGWVTAALATALWTLVDVGGFPVGIRYGLILWNSAIELAFFSGVSLLVSFVARQAHHLQELAREDSLTGVANRRAFFEALRGLVDLAMRRASAWTLVYIDVDDFKRVNDRLGHRVGDEVLRAMGGSLRAATRRTDVIARLGGDEFAVLMPETDARQAEMAVQKLQALLDSGMEKGRWPVTFSIGVTTFLSVPPSPDAALAAADAQMYEVKRGRKAAVSFGVWDAGHPEPLSQSVPG